MAKLEARTPPRRGVHASVAHSMSSVLEKSPNPATPTPVKNFEALQRYLRRRLGKALAENHLAINPAIDLMVYIFDARAGQVRRYSMQDLLSMNRNEWLLSDSKTLRCKECEKANDVDSSHSQTEIWRFY